MTNELPLAKPFVLQLLCLFLCMTNLHADITSNLQAFWSFNGDPLDDSGNGNDGTASGAILTTDRFNESNRAYYFDGTNDYISITNINLDISSSSLSIAAWFKTSGSSNGRIFSKGSSGCITGYMVRTANSNTNILLEMSSGNSCVVALTGTTTINDNNWHHMVVTATSGGMAYVYIDGSEDISASIPSYDVDNSRTPLIGINDVNYAEPFLGNIDEVRVYSRVLSTNDVLELYNLGPTMAPTIIPTTLPTNMPSQTTNDPTDEPSTEPSSEPSGTSSTPTDVPSEVPSIFPTGEPSDNPSSIPSSDPSMEPSTNQPSVQPSIEPSIASEPSGIVSTLSLTDEGGLSSSTMIAATTATSMTLTEANPTRAPSSQGDESSSDISTIVYTFGIVLGIMFLICFCLIMVIIIGCYLHQKKMKTDLVNEMKQTIDNKYKNNNNTNVNLGGTSYNTGSLKPISSTSYQTDRQLNNTGTNVGILQIIENDHDPTHLKINNNPNSVNVNVGENNDLAEIEDILNNIELIKNNKQDIEMEGIGNENNNVNSTNGIQMNDEMEREQDDENSNGDTVKGSNVVDGIGRGVKSTMPLNWQMWKDKQLIVWLNDELLSAGFDQQTVKQFLAKFVQVHLTGRLLESWLNNKTQDEIMNELQSRVDFNKKSYVWDAAIQAIMQLGQ